LRIPNQKKMMNMETRPIQSSRSSVKNDFIQDHYTKNTRDGCLQW
jgi:hypothetical protein